MKLVVVIVMLAALLFGLSLAAPLSDSNDVNTIEADETSRQSLLGFLDAMNALTGGDTTGSTSTLISFFNNPVSSLSNIPGFNTFRNMMSSIANFIPFI